MKRERLAMAVDRAIFIYITAFIIYGFVGRIIPLYMFVNEPANGYIYILFFIAGVVLTAADFLCYRHMLQGKDCYILYGFIVVMILSSLMNLKYGYIDNIKTILWTGIQVSVFYSVYTRLTKEQMMKYIYGLFGIISMIWTAAIVYSLVQFVTGASYGVEIWEDEWKLQGFRERRLFGIFNDPNYAGVTCVWVMLMLLFIICRSRRRWLRFFCIVSMVCQLTYIVLSGSRTAVVCLFGGSFVCVFLMLKNRYLNKKGAVQFLIRFLASVIVICLLGAVSAGIKKGMPYLPEKYLKYRVHKVTVEDQDAEQEEKDLAIQMAGSFESVGAENLLNRGDVTKENISNNRLAIWKNYIQASKDTCILGASPRNILRHMEEEHPLIYEKNRDYETHNGFISLYAGTGILGTAVILIFMVLAGKRILRYCFGREKMDWQFAIIFSILVAIVIYACFFTELFFVNNLTTALFWILLGTLLYWTDDAAQVIPCKSWEI